MERFRDHALYQVTYLHILNAQQKKKNYIRSESHRFAQVIQPPIVGCAKYPIDAAAAEVALRGIT